MYKISLLFLLLAAIALYLLHKKNARTANSQGVFDAEVDGSECGEVHRLKNGGIATSVTLKIHI